MRCMLYLWIINPRQAGVPSFSSISHLLVWTVLVFCISTDLSAPKLWINPLCWTFYCLTSVCLFVSLGLYSSQLQRWWREFFAMMSYICVICEAIYTADILTHTVEKAQVALTVIQLVSAGKGWTESIKKRLKSIKASFKITETLKWIAVYFLMHSLHLFLLRQAKMSAVKWDLKCVRDSVDLILPANLTHVLSISFCFSHFPSLSC